MILDALAGWHAGAGALVIVLGLAALYVGNPTASALGSSAGFPLAVGQGREAAGWWSAGRTSTREPRCRRLPVRNLVPAVAVHHDQVASGLPAAHRRE